MKLRFIAIFSTTLLVSGISIVLISNPAQSARAVPKVTTTYSFYFAPQTTRLTWNHRDLDCLDEGCEVTRTDPYGPPLKEAGITFVNRVRNLPTGWSVCTDPDAFKSLSKYRDAGFIQLPSNEWALYDLDNSAGDGGYNSENNFEQSFGFIYQPNNSKRPKYQGYVLICGPDPRTPSGTMWKVVLGPVITLPAPKTWR